MRVVMAAGVLVLACVQVGFAQSPPPAPAAGQGQRVLAVVETLFRAMKAGDAETMEGLMHEDVRLVSTAIRDGQPTARVVDVADWLSSVASSPRELDERIRDPLVRVSGGLAVVWTDYDLYVDGAHSHCGVDLFELVRLPAGWKILSIADTRATEGCLGH